MQENYSDIDTYELGVKIWDLKTQGESTISGSFTGLSEDDQRQLQGLILAFIQRPDHEDPLLASFNEFINEYIELMITYAKDAEIDTSFVQELKNIYPHLFFLENLPEIDTKTLDKEAAELLDTFRPELGLAQLLREEVAELETMVKQAKQEKPLGKRKLADIEEKSDSIETMVNASKLPDPAKRIFLKAISDLRIELAEHNRYLEKDIEEIEKLKNSIIKSKKADPQQVLLFVEKVGKLRESLRRLEKSSGVTNYDLSSKLNSSLDEVSKKAKETINNASTFSQIKGVVKEKVLNISSSREKLEHLNTVLAQEKFHLNKDLPIPDTKPRSSSRGR